MRRELHAVLMAVICLHVSQAAAQAPIDPYGKNVAWPRCRRNIYTEQVVCRAAPLLLETYGLRYTIGETRLGTPQHDKGWLVLVNLEDQPQQALIEFIVPWDPQPYYIATELPAKSRASIELHDDPLFWDPGNSFRLRLSVFTTNVYCERACYPQTTVSPADMWSHEWVSLGVVVPRPTPAQVTQR